VTQRDGIGGAATAAVAIQGLMVSGENKKCLDSNNIRQQQSATAVAS